MDIDVFKRLGGEGRNLIFVAGQGLGYHGEGIKVVDARFGEGHYNGGNLLADGIGIEQEILTAGVELLVTWKNVIDFVLRDDFLTLPEFCADFDIFGLRICLDLSPHHILLIIRSGCEHVRRIEIIRVELRVVGEDLEIVTRRELHVLHIEIAFAFCNRSKGKRNLRIASCDDKGLRIRLHDVLGKRRRRKRDFFAVKARRELFYGTGRFQVVGGFSHSIGEQDLLALRRRHRIEFGPADCLIIGVAQRKRLLVLVHGFCRGHVQRRIRIAGRELFRMQAVEVLYGCQFV